MPLCTLRENSGNYPTISDFARKLDSASTRKYEDVIRTPLSASKNISRVLCAPFSMSDKMDSNVL